MALYLKYRPQSFADVVGQDHIVTTLEQSVARGRISHAYLFCGTRGTGKTSVARILAKTILLRGIDDEAVKAHMVRGIEEGSFVDLIEIDAASNRRIDDIRELIEKINFAPAVSKAKVYIIDEVHMLTKEAFNALLKTLEEPPEYAFFILATTELHKVPDTIQSRCQRFLFKRVKDEDVLRRLQYITDQERITIDREALRSIARHALGSFRDGIALLDQLRSLEKITQADVSERVGATSTAFVEDLIQVLHEKNASKIPGLVEQMEIANIPLDIVTGDLLSAVREGMHAALLKNESIHRYREMTEILLHALKDLRSSPVPGLVLEAALLSLCMEAERGNASVTIPHPVHEGASASTPAKKEEKHLPEVSKSEEISSLKHAIVEAEELSLENVTKHWEEVGRAVTPPSVRMSLKDATIASVEQNTVKLAFSSAFHRDKVMETKASRMVEDLLLGIFKKSVRIQCMLEKGKAEGPVGPSTDLVEAAAEVFGGF